jgi:hypothetical protein
LVRRPLFQWILPRFLGLVTIASPIKAVTLKGEFSASALPTWLTSRLGNGSEDNKATRSESWTYRFPYHFTPT